VADVSTNKIEDAE